VSAAQALCEHAELWTKGGGLNGGEEYAYDLRPALSGYELPKP